jgi:hypothetical protein
MLAAARKVLAFQMTIAEWIGTGAMLAVPYLLIGVVWTAIAGDQIGWDGSARILSILVSIASWPVLIVPAVCTI